MAEERHHAGVARPRRGPVGGVVLAQMAPAGAVLVQMVLAGAVLARIILAGAVLAQMVLAGVVLAQIILAGAVLAQMAQAGVVRARIILAGAVRARMILAGVRVPKTTGNHPTDGRMNLVLQASRRLRLSGIPRQGPLAMGGEPVEPIWDLIGEVPRSPTKAKKHL